MQIRSEQHRHAARDVEERERLHDSWAAIKSYFLSLGEDQCPKALWQLLKTDQDVEGQPLELQAYLAFLNNILKIFHDVVLLLEGQDMTVCELYDIMLILKTKLQQREIDCFYGMETSAILQQFPDQKAATIKHDFSNFYKTALNYLEKCAHRLMLSSCPAFEESLSANNT
ncbi:hypothetical protein MHYP_G00044180 [Metynnis hypsauchen]